jgi:hypothetical protein
MASRRRLGYTTFPSCLLGQSDAHLGHLRLPKRTCPVRGFKVHPKPRERHTQPRTIQQSHSPVHQSRNLGLLLVDSDVAPWMKSLSGVSTNLPSINLKFLSSAFLASMPAVKSLLSSLASITQRVTVTLLSRHQTPKVSYAEITIV